MIRYPPHHTCLSLNSHQAIALAFQDLQTGVEEVYTLLENDMETPDGGMMHTEMVSIDCETLSLKDVIHAMMSDLGRSEYMKQYEPQSAEQGAREAMSALETQLKAFKPNAFAVTVLCVDGMFESRALDMIPHAFELFPEREYVVLTLPSGVAEPPLLRSFNLAVPRVGTTFSHSLYILHRDMLLAPEHLVVQRLSPRVHGEAVQKLIHDMPQVSHAHPRRPPVESR